MTEDLWFVVCVRDDGRREFFEPGETNRQHAEAVRDYLQRCNRSQRFELVNLCANI